MHDKKILSPQSLQMYVLTLQTLQTSMMSPSNNRYGKCYIHCITDINKSQSFERN